MPVISNKSIYDSDLPHRAVSVYMYLRDRADKNNSCFPGIRTIARELNLSVSTVKRALNDLVTAGFVGKIRRYRENGGNSSNLYMLRSPPDHLSEQRTDHQQQAKDQQWYADNGADNRDG
jgi:predicted transcriptional regulator